MKKRLFQLIPLLFVVFCFEAVLLSQNTKEQNIKSIIGMTINEETMSSPIARELAEQEGLPPELIKLLLDMVFDRIDMEDFRNYLVPAFDEFFTEDEIATLTAFYKSETGKKHLNIQPALELHIEQFITDYVRNNFFEILENAKLAFKICEEIDSLLTIAWDYIDSGNYDKSMEQLKSIEQEYLPEYESMYISVRQESLIVRIYNARFEVNMTLENYQEAINNMNTLMEKYPDIESNYEKLAEAKIKARDYQGAITALTKVIELNEEPPADYYSDRALARDYLGDFEGAEADYDTVLSLTSSWNYIVCLVNIGWNKYLVGQYEKCIEYSDRALEADPSDFIAGYNKALSNLCLGNSDSALELYKKYKEESIGSYNSEEYNTGAITDLKNLISKGFKAEEAKKILIDVFNLSESEIIE